ncbi:MAG: bacterioferritin [Candidatus Contendobacter odensis]|uniref:Bacterioferritin n=1 Tax=Candidatus Contendibacter odensensis TaxID=1400860 RepID=A0A2G6PEI2_9GAMM|nr:MAG: bacterioferritin [Candidatus Contendobacter odensis]
MKDSAKVIEDLNKVLKNELGAINQYVLHTCMLESGGINTPGQYECGASSIDEMKHADQLIQRTLDLEGLPNSQDLGKLYTGENVDEIFRGDLKLEHAAHPPYHEAAAYCENCGDTVTRDPLASIFANEETHIGWLETQPGLIGRSLPVYLQAQL